MEGGTFVRMLAPTMHLSASTSYGFSAPAGQALTHLLHLPQRSLVNGLSTGSSASVTTTPNRSHGPCLGDITSEFLPNAPMPASIARRLCDASSEGYAALYPNPRSSLMMSLAIMLSGKYPGYVPLPG